MMGGRNIISSLKPGTWVDEQYEIIEFLGETQLSTIYKARPAFVHQMAANDQFCILKFIVRPLDVDPDQTTGNPIEEGSLGEIRRNFELLGKIDPAYTARWIGFGHVYLRDGKLITHYQRAKGQKFYFIALEYLEGVNLQDYIRYTPPSTEKALQMMQDILHAVKAIHAVNWIHRDIKPANFIVTPEGKVKIIDFGISKRLEETRGTGLGTPGYMPPEIRRAGSWSYASDLYMVAGTFIALLCQECLDIDGNYVPHKDFGKIREKVSPAIAEIIERNNAEKPEHRDRSAVEMLEALKAAIQNPDEPVIPVRLEIDLYQELRERHDHHRLCQAVLQAEALEAEGRLPTDLVSPLNDARLAYDQIRTNMGELITLIRWDGLDEKKKGLNRLNALVMSGQENLYDPTTDGWRPAEEMLKEANKIFANASEETLQYELTGVAQALNASPLLAKHRLDKALEKPYLASHRKILEEKLYEVEAVIIKKSRAEDLLAQASREDDPIRAFGLVLDAREIYADQLGLEAFLERKRRAAYETLAERMRTFYYDVETCLKNRQYSDARRWLDLAVGVPAAWPDGPLPEALQTFLGWADPLRTRITHEETAYRDFNALAEKVREFIHDPSRCKAGLDCYNQKVRSDPRFSGFVELQILDMEVTAASEHGGNVSEDTDNDA